MNQIEKLNVMINNKMIEVEQWKSIATGTTAHSDGERVQSSGSQQKMADAVGKYVDIEKEINECIDRLVDVKNDVIRTIEQLPVIEYDLLHMVYVQQRSLDEAASKYRKSYTWATTIHGNALKHVQDILDRKENTDEE